MASISLLSLELPPLFANLQIPLLYLNNIIALAIGPRYQRLRVSISLPVFVLLASQSLYREWHGPWGNHYAMNCLVMSISMVYVDWILLASPDKEKWRKIKYDKLQGSGKGTVEGKANGAVVKKKEGNVVPVGFLSRMWWGIRLATTNRYVGWSCQVKNVPSEVDSDYPRVLFLAHKIVRTGIFWVLKNILYAYTAASPHGSWMDIASIKPAVSFASYPFWHRFWYAWVHIMLTAVSLDLYNSAYGVVSVATGLANPKDCPPAFGDVRKLVSVRNAWSSVWHQQCRRLCSAPGIFITRDVLGLRKGSFASKYLQLFIGFGISGVVHSGATMLTLRSFEDDASFAFFVGQAFIIMIEDHVIDFGKSLGLEDSLFWRLVGFSWTLFAIGATSQVWTGKAVGHGMWIHDREPDWFGIGPKVVP